MSIEADIEALAAHVAKRAMEKDTPLEAVTDMFKTLVQFYAIRVKRKLDTDDDDSDSTMDDLREQIHGSQNGHGRAVRSS